MIHLTAGGEAGRHLTALVTPLVIHDLPVTVWWPNEPLFRSPPVRDLMATADRLVVDGSSWTGDGLDRLRPWPSSRRRPASPSATSRSIRQSRWREAIASIFDDPDFLPYLRSLRRIAVAYATHDETGAPGSTNIVKPVYHVALAGVATGAADRDPAAPGRRTRRRRRGPRPGVRREAQVGRGLAATLARRPQRNRRGRPAGRPRRCPPGRRCASSCSRSGADPSSAPTSPPRRRPSGSGCGRTASRRSIAISRRLARTEVDLLAQAIEASGRDRVADGGNRGPRRHRSDRPKHAS